MLKLNIFTITLTSTPSCSVLMEAVSEDQNNLQVGKYTYIQSLNTGQNANGGQVVCSCSERAGKLHRHENVSRQQHKALWVVCLTGLAYGLYQGFPN
jgi:hypothetical protein